MAGKKLMPNGSWQFVFKRSGVLDKPLYMTFAVESEGDEYAARLDALLDRGIMPDEFRPESKVTTLAALISLYEHEALPSQKDKGALNVCVKRWGATVLPAINAAWVDARIGEMKHEEKLAPSSIRARIGALARCTDWGMRKGHLAMPDHPLRTLPDGYSQYSAKDTKLAGVKRTDIDRDRRLERGEYEKILEVIAGGVLARKQRPLHFDADLHRMFFIAGLESAMRMSELYTLHEDQVDFNRRTIFLDKTKNGDKRQVPMSSVLLSALQEYMPNRVIPPGNPQDLVFGFWNGDNSPRSRASTSDYVSTRFIQIFEQAKCDDLGFHDLRHEATSRLFEKTTLSETAIMRITGHKSHRMMMRYANLRGSDLANALW